MSEHKQKEKEKEKAQKIKIAEIAIGRHEKGLEIKIKSKVIEEFMKSVYGTDVSISERHWSSGEKYYRKNTSTQHPIMNATRHTVVLDGFNREELIDANDTLNLGMLRIVGISEGKKFVFRGLYRESDIAAIAQSINEALKNMFKEYNTPTCYEIEVIAEV